MIIIIALLGSAGKKEVSKEKEEASEDVDLSKVCAGLNYYKSGEDPVIKDDGDYPDWLWTVSEPVKSHKELSPDSKFYWRRLNKQKARNNNLLRKQMGR